MWRFKGILERHFKLRKFENQKTALYLKSFAMNKMANLSMPASKWIAV